MIKVCQTTNKGHYTCQYVALKCYLKGSKYNNYFDVCLKFHVHCIKMHKGSILTQYTCTQHCDMNKAHRKPYAGLYIDLVWKNAGHYTWCKQTFREHIPTLAIYLEWLSYKLILPQMIYPSTVQTLLFIGVISLRSIPGLCFYDVCVLLNECLLAFLFKPLELFFFML